MRRIAATLAVVGALLFSAGSAWADRCLGGTTNVQEYLPRAEQGDAWAQDRVGAAYEMGFGCVSKDYDEALKWFRKSAGNGHPNGQLSLGDMYADGKGVPENDVEAVKWYRKAAEQGHSHGQIALGYMYMLGEGVPKDVIRAYMWISLTEIMYAIDPTFRERTLIGDARFHLDMLSKFMTPAEITKAKTLAAEWWAEWWEKHNNMHGEGVVVPENDSQKVKVYREFAEQGDARSQYTLGVMYAKGTDLPVDNIKAYMWLLLAMMQGQETAAANLDIVRKRMTSAQIAKAQALAAEWREKHNN